MAKTLAETDREHPFTDGELGLIERMESENGYRYGTEKWLDLLDEWHWWAANWRKHPGYFLGKVGVLSFDVFLGKHDVADRGRKIYEKLSGTRRVRRFGLDRKPKICEDAW